MNDLAWEYPILVVLAIGVGVWFFNFLTKQESAEEPSELERSCTRCKLVVRGKATVDYRHCPFCGASYLITPSSRS